MDCAERHVNPPAISSASVRQPKAIRRQFFACTRGEPMRSSHTWPAAWYGVAGAGLSEYRTRGRLKRMEIPFKSRTGVIAQAGASPATRVVARAQHVRGGHG